MNVNLNILIVDDQAVFSDTLKESLSTLGYKVYQAFTGETALDILHDQKMNVVFLDVFLPDINGFDLINKIRKEWIKCEIIIMTAYSQSDFIKRSIRQGSYFLPKPFKIEDLSNILTKIERNVHPVKKVNINQEKEINSTYLKSKSKLIDNSLKLALKYANSDLPVLIKGEKGTGREKIANYIHMTSKRKNNNFTIFNCDSLPAHLVQLHLFGYEKNAFKGALRRKYGLIEVIDNGTLFLEDYDALPINIQTKLLKFIETGSFRRLGGIDNINSNVRIITSTTLQDHNDDKNKLNKELFSKLNTLSIEMPPLRKRKSDISLLINDFLIINNINPDDFTIDSSVNKILNNYDWPKNIFELEALTKQAILLTNGNGMYIENIPINIATFDGGTVKKNYSLDDIDKQHIQNVLLKAKGNKAKAARILGVDRKTLYRKIEKLGIMEDE